MISELPVTAIEGIGPKGAEALSKIAVFSVADLVRASAEHMHRVVDRVSLDTVRRWRAMALLIEVDGMDGQWAEALVTGGVPTVDALRTKQPAELVLVFADARNGGVIPSVPDDATIVRMLLDATRIHFTGRMNGTVLDKQGVGIAAVEAACGGARTTTDARGRFRLARITLGEPLRLRLSATGYAPVIVDRLRVTRNDEVVDIQVFEMEAAHAGGPVPSRASEYKGNVLPPLTPNTTTTEARSDPLRDSDVFILHRFYDNGDAQLVSKFLEYEDGRFLTLHWRVPIDRFPSPPGIKSGWRFRRGELAPIKLNPSVLEMLRAQRRRHAQFRDRAQPETRIEWDERRMEMAAFITSDRRTRR